MPREPGTVFGGRLRTSTLALMIVFAGVLTLFVFVRPPLAKSANSDTTPSAPNHTAATPKPSHTSTPTPVPTPTTPTPTTVRAPSPTTDASPTSPGPSRTHASLLPLPSHT